MKDVEFLGEKEVGVRPRRTWAQQIKSSTIQWVIHKKLAKREHDAYILILVFTVLIFVAAIVLFLITPAKYVPPPIVAPPSGLIKVPDSVR